ncbi:hypothetical protein F7725_015104 [Dissostichus mawsoni]|uniref:Uncharacterized protein n=1 Tax=Dissostichus mawsoni TaxID=36200 RepID=A0A7J5YJF1_DISMA|nr:hypothetical protein F7725_015104 [Dissostichus mawsoni]
MDSSQCGTARLGLFLVLIFLSLCRRFSDACPASCTCTITRIVCIDPEPGIEDFPVLTLDDMENITEMYDGVNVEALRRHVGRRCDITKH